MYVGKVGPCEIFHPVTFLSAFCLEWKVPVPFYGDPEVQNGTQYLQAVWEEVIEHHYEYPGYDGWYNNRAHPEWGAAGKCHQSSA